MNNFITKYHHPSEIPNRKYTGYIWFSDKKSPRPFLQNEYDWTQVKVNPFIIEGLLYCKNEEEETAITIRHTGEYLIREFDLKNLPETAQLESVKYLPHRLDNVKKVCFDQLWLPEVDENCENMKVLTLQTLIFKGFEMT